MLFSAKALQQRRRLYQATWGRLGASDVDWTGTLCLSHADSLPRCKVTRGSPPCSSRTTLLLFKYLCSMEWPQPMTELPKYIFQISQRDKRNTLRSQQRSIIHRIHPFILQREHSSHIAYRRIGNSSSSTPPKLKSSCRFSDVTMLATIWPTSHRGDEAGPCSAPTRKGTVRTTHRSLTDSPLPIKDTHPHLQALIPTTPTLHEGHSKGVLMTQRCQWTKGLRGPAAM